MEIHFTPEVDKRLKNVSALPRGLGAPFLLCLRGEGSDLIAKQWLRKRPQALAWNNVLVCFKKEE